MREYIGQSFQNNNNIEVLVMGTSNNKHNASERRIFERRKTADRRCTTRFSDALGRRSGVERRLPIN
jgi:hypothetical protein